MALTTGADGNSYVQAMIDRDGGLHSLGWAHSRGWYLDWTPGEEEVTLDGRFTADDLRAIAAHMDARPK